MLRPLILALFLAAAATAPALTIVDGRPRHMEEDLFKTVSEYLTGEADDGDRVVLRSRPDVRTGQYFILGIEPSTAAIPGDAQITLEVIPADAREIQTFRFSIPTDPESAGQLYLGLTGEDWPGPDVRPVAWRVTIRSGGSAVAEWKSFLWEMP